MRHPRVLTPLAAALALLVSACGAAKPYEHSDGSYRQEPAPAPGARHYDFEGEAVADDYARPQVASTSARRPSSPSKAAKPSQSPQPRQQAPSTPKADKPSAPMEAMVVYVGYLRLRVKRLLGAIDAITELTQQAGGYIASMSARAVVVRIPATDFDSVLARFAQLGDVLGRRVEALDVTAQFTDLSARLEVARNARDRLLALLEQTKDSEERLRILQEIKRQSELIESLTSTLASLQNLVDYFTITLELEPIVETSARNLPRSPFSWVRDLRPHRVTLDDGKDDLTMKVPAGFVLFDDDDVFRAQSADTSMLRAARVDNEPRGDAAFWMAAVQFEMDGREEETVAQGQAGALTYRFFRNKDVAPRVYLVAVHAAGEDLFVVEGFFPTEDAFTKHRDAVVQSLSTFRVQ